ncbi:MAG: ribonuclease III [Proteobacteria bacterium]|nr:ribonuclease III [Pseudomonadota bacterium]HQR04743.1 ribonuclease III [Rhodocyclaceae bacterium]
MNPAQLGSRLDYRFNQPDLLLQALTHRSFGSLHNERLEFLGDSILNCVAATLLYRRFPALKEGDLSRLRTGLVRQEALFEIALKLDLGECVRLGEGELKSGGHRRPSILADALEAIFGAVYLDGGFDQAFVLVERLVTPLLERIDPKDVGKDPKTSLQEMLQGRRLPLPRYALMETRGEAHLQEFEVECVVPELGLTAQGKGHSRRAAEQDAARQILQQARQP